MINGKSVIAVVPARAGSKGLPGKNTRTLCGKPLIAWTIEAGLKSQYIDFVVVSTDSKDIATIAENYGATIPFLRPPELATDKTTSIEVIRHVIDYYNSTENKQFEYVVLLEPTSPLRDEGDLDRAIRQLVENTTAKSIVGISLTSTQNPEFLVKISEGGRLVGFNQSEIKTIRRQNIEEIYFLEGSVYVSDTHTLIKEGTFYHKDTFGCIFPKWKSFEVDDIDDFIIVEALFMAKRMEK
jgi:CMP-N,N'-diacetyllegionaminic acid synthase